MKKLLIYIICVSWALFGNAQLNTADLGKKPNIPTWETYEFMKYGSVGASLYTGTVSYSVPLYTYKDNEFEMPISVDYATNGFRINHKSGILGQSWSLGGIGKITREIKGLPDERRKTVFGAGDMSSMTIRGYKEISNEPLVKDILCGGDNRVYTCFMSADNQAYDAEPDIYHFNFCGFSGSFRRAKRDSNGNHRFVFFNESTNSRAISVKELNEASNIVLLDGNGYEYTFQADEYIKEHVDDAEGAASVRKITSWHLSKITAPSGRKVEFIYHTNDVHEGESSYYPTLSYGFSFIGSNTLVDGGSSSEIIEVVEHKSFNSVLTAILFPDNTRLLFNYEPAEQEFFHASPNGNGTLYPVLRNPERMSSISVYNGGKLQKSIKFTYDVQRSPYHGTGNPITFLQGIDISGQGQFGFDYYPMAGYPALGSIKCDHWGYYNGESGGFNVYNSFFNNLIYDSNYNESYSSSFHKSPNFNAALSGSLKQISYPTGGYSEFSYEPHTYCKNVVRNSSTMFYPELQDADSTVETGGIRIKQIVTYLSNGAPNDTTTYDYGSGGNLLNAPRYGIRYCTTTSSLSQKRVLHFNLANDMYNYNRTHIEYSQVREYKSGKGYKDYHYSTYSDYPDPEWRDVLDYEDRDARLNIFNIYEGDGLNKTRVYSTSPNNLVTNILTPIASMQQKRGLLTKEDFYDSNGTLLKSKQNTYSFPSVCVDTIFTITGEIAREVYYPRFNIDLTRSVETDYFDNHQIAKRASFKYNKYGMPTEISSSSSDDIDIVETTQYSGDTLATSGILMSMRENHIVNAVIQSETKKGETTLNKTRYTYYRPNEENSALIRPASTEIWTQEDGWLTTNTYLFDNKGLLRQITDADSIKTSYLWSYCGKHPVAIAQNSEWQTLVHGLASIGCGTPELLAESVNIDDATFGRLSTLGAHLPNASVSIYRYKPNAGVSEVVMPNSLRAYYAYDGYGRMTSISDDKKKRLEQIEYNLVTIKPLTASLSCPASCHINDSIMISADSQGGFGAHSYDWNIKDSRGNSVYSLTSSSNQLDLVPYVIGIHAEEDYIVECTVTDLLSEESVELSGMIHINHAIVEFSNISTSHDFESGSGIVSASIYTDTPVTVSFRVDRICAGTCTLKIGNTMHTVANRFGTYSYSLESGSTDVELTVASSFAETNVSMQIISAGDREIGNDNCINLEF